MAEKLSLKTKVLVLFCAMELTPQDLFNKALLLFGEATKGRGSFAYYNRSGFSPERLKSLEYDLKKAAQVSALDVATYKSSMQPVQEIKTLDTSDAIVSFTQELEKNEPAAQGFKLINLYPFLDNDDCPDEFKILVSDMMKAFRDFKTQHAALTELLFGNTDKNIAPVELTQEQMFELGGSVVAQWQLNEQIDEELRYYAEHGEVLGNHPLLADMKLQQDVYAIPVSKLNDEAVNLKRNITNNERKLTEVKDDVAQEKIKHAITNYKNRLKLVELRQEELNKPQTLEPTKSATETDADVALKVIAIEDLTYPKLKSLAALIGSQEGLEPATDQKKDTLVKYCKDHFKKSLEVLKDFEFPKV